MVFRPVSRDAHIAFTTFTTRQQKGCKLVKVTIIFSFYAERAPCFSASACFGLGHALFSWMRVGWVGVGKVCLNGCAMFVLLCYGGGILVIMYTTSILCAIPNARRVWCQGSAKRRRVGTNENVASTHIDEAAGEKGGKVTGVSVHISLERELSSV